jgi:transcriptional regulator with PAS, ATPase and Fis domain
VLEDHKVRRLGSKVETPVDVRVLAATNKDADQAVAKGELRQDLYFRLNVFHIHLPPLRDRKEDIPLLVEYMLRELNAKHGRQVRGVNPDVLEMFAGYSWPGNVRELRNVLERASIVSNRDLIGRAHLPGDFGHAFAAAASDLASLRFPPGTTVEAVERALILQTMAATSNKTRAAELLGISLKTLHNKLKEYEAAKVPSQ